MLLDTKSGLVSLHTRLAQFLSSVASSARFDAVTSGSPAPYQELLSGLRLVKTKGKRKLTLDADRWLVLEGSEQELSLCIDAFNLEKEFGHSHLYTGPIALIIEADGDAETNITN